MKKFYQNYKPPTPMSKLKIEIKSWYTGSVLFEYESEVITIKKTVEAAIKAKADLSWADLSKANLSEANLSEANLSEANLSEANLSEANLSWANLSEANLSEADLSWADLSWADLSKADLSWANLSWANLSEANLSVIKSDFFYVLLKGIKEIPFLKKNLIEGKIEGSTYEGECACLSGTLYNAATKNNGEQEPKRKSQILDCRDAYRPAERWFLGIRKGDTPDNNALSKITLEWIEEFELLIAQKEIA